MINNGEHYCELSIAQGRVVHLTRLLAEANAMIDVLQGKTVLSQRERQILELTARGLSMKEVATELAISAKTCGCYRERLMQKLAVHDAVRLTHCAIRLGVIDP